MDSSDKFLPSAIQESDFFESNLHKSLPVVWDNMQKLLQRYTASPQFELSKVWHAAAFEHLEAVLRAKVQAEPLQRWRECGEILEREGDYWPSNHDVSGQEVSRSRAKCKI